MVTYFLWVFLIVISALGAVGYNLAVKLAGEINAFLFATCFTVVAFVLHLCCFFIYKWNYPAATDLSMSKQTVAIAIFAGVSTVIIDLSFFFAMKYGSYVLTATIPVIASMILSVIAGYFLFNEMLSFEKMAGLVLGFIALYLLIK